MPDPFLFWMPIVLIVLMVIVIITTLATRDKDTDKGWVLIVICTLEIIALSYFWNEVTMGLPPRVPTIKLPDIVWWK